MNGAESLMRTAREAGIELCFANPGTTEMPLVAALDAVPGIRPVLGLFEGVCTGAADGYARVSGLPALTLLHLGPGFANGIANLHNARRAASPVLNLIGDHASWHRAADAPLTSDIESLAAPVGRVVTSRSAATLAEETAAAIASALGPPGGVTSLIVPADCQWGEATAAAPPAPVRARAAVDDARTAGLARILRERAPAALLLGGDALVARGLRAAARVARTSGCALFVETFPARLERGQGLPDPPRLPYFPERATRALDGLAHLILAGAREPVAFFGYPGGRSRLEPEGCRTLPLARPEEDAAGALEALAEALGAPAEAGAAPARERPELPSGALDPASLGQALAALQPEDAVVVDEAATSGMPYWLAAPAAPPHLLLTLTGGAIGQGLPCATGAALARPGARVIALQADGSAAYTLQALWTQARESLDVTTIVCANRSYRILRIELGRTGIPEPGPQALALTDLSRPALDWAALARGFGVPAVRVETADALVEALGRSLAQPGPSLIEALLL